MNLKEEELNSKDIATCPLADVDIFDPKLLGNPYPFYARLRDEAPIYRDPNTGIVSISTDELIREANSKPEIFSNDFSAMLQSGSTEGPSEEELAVLATGWQVVDTMLTADPPDHTRYRKLAMQAFSARRVAGMEEVIRDICNGLLDKISPRGECEFKSEFAAILPMYVIVDALGAPRKDFELFRKWSDAFVLQLSGSTDKAARLQAAHDVVEFQHYFVDMIEKKRRSPTEDVISDLVHANLAEEGDPKTMEYDELLSILQQLLVAGNESTSNVLTAGMHDIITYPEQAAQLVGDLTLIKNFVEETLRMLAPSNNMWRVVKQDIELGGFEFQAGDAVLVRYGSANRDCARFEDPNTFDIHRKNARTHMSFGFGIHTCIGLKLARKELNIAFEILLDRLQNIQLSSKQGELKYTPNLLLRGPEELHITFNPA